MAGQAEVRADGESGVKPKLTEEQVAAAVVHWLEDAGHDVYQEVELSPGGIRADIVALAGPEVWIIETKLSLSIALIEQAMERRRFAHRIYVAVPVRLRSSLLSELGIGAISVEHTAVLSDDHRSFIDAHRVRIAEESRRWNTRPVKLRGRLSPEHKTHARAGAPTGGHWSQFRATCKQLAEFVRRQPGSPMRLAVESIKHHYASAAGARTSLYRWVSEGKVPGVCLRDGALWPKEAA